MSKLLTYPNDGYRAISCPGCRQEVRVDRRGDQLTFACRGGCTGADVAARVDHEKILAELLATAEPAMTSNGSIDAGAAAEQLTTLLGLSKVGLRVSGGRVVGPGSAASADIYLSSGDAIRFESLRDVANSTRLMVEVTACTGAEPELSAKGARRALALLRGLAEHQESLTADEIAADWGHSYLQAATVIDVNLGDQAERWAAFERVAHHDPFAAARESAKSLDTAGLVLRDVDSSRLIRCGWFRSAVRSQDSSISPQQLAMRMKRVGWMRRRVKATRPGFTGQLLWEFYRVPAGWETDGGPTGQVNE